LTLSPFFSRMLMTFSHPGAVSCFGPLHIGCYTAPPANSSSDEMPFSPHYFLAPAPPFFWERNCPAMPSALDRHDIDDVFRFLGELIETGRELDVLCRKRQDRNHRCNDMFLISPPSRLSGCV
jgi:hypothetical protein